MFNLTFYAMRLFFRHQKDSGSWSIYKGENFFNENCILALSAARKVARMTTEIIECYHSRYHFTVKQNKEWTKKNNYFNFGHFWRFLILQCWRDDKNRNNSDRGLAKFPFWSPLWYCNRYLFYYKQTNITLSNSFKSIFNICQDFSMQTVVKKVFC